MKYLKTYKSINESASGDLTFEDFKDIFTDVTDKHDKFKFYVYEDDPDDFYQIIIGFDYQGGLHDIYHNGLEFLHKHGNYDEPSFYDVELYTDIEYSISDKNKELLSYKEEIDRAIEFNEKVMNILKEINKYIIPKLRSFSNCKEIQIGFDVDCFVIEFHLTNRVIFESRVL